MLVHVRWAFDSVTVNTFICNWIFFCLWHKIRHIDYLRMNYHHNIRHSRHKIHFHINIGLRTLVFAIDIDSRDILIFFFFHNCLLFSSRLCVNLTSKMSFYFNVPMWLSNFSEIQRCVVYALRLQLQRNTLTMKAKKKKENVNLTSWNLQVQAFRSVYTLQFAHVYNYKLRCDNKNSNSGIYE